jgi:hypothetical protein
MPKPWIIALNNYAKHNGFENRAEAIRGILYPAFVRELKCLDTGITIESIVEHKKIIKKPSVSKSGRLLSTGNVNRFKKALKIIIKNSPKTVRLYNAANANRVRLQSIGNVNRHKTFTSFSNFIIETSPAKRFRLSKLRQYVDIERKDTRQADEKYIEHKPMRDLGYKKPKRKKEWKASVPRRAMERSSLIHRRPLR